MKAPVVALKVSVGTRKPAKKKSTPPTGAHSGSEYPLGSFGGGVVTDKGRKK